MMSNNLLGLLTDLRDLAPKPNDNPDSKGYKAAQYYDVLCEALKGMELVEYEVTYISDSDLSKRTSRGFVAVRDDRSKLFKDAMDPLWDLEACLIKRHNIKKFIQTRYTGSDGKAVSRRYD